MKLNVLSMTHGGIFKVLWKKLLLYQVGSVHLPSGAYTESVDESTIKVFAFFNIFPADIQYREEILLLQDIYRIIIYSKSLEIS